MVLSRNIAPISWLADANVLVLAGRTPSSRFDVVSATCCAAQSEASLAGRGKPSLACPLVGTRRHRRFVAFRLALQRFSVRAAHYHDILAPEATENRCDIAAGGPKQRLPRYTSPGTRAARNGIARVRLDGAAGVGAAGAVKRQRVQAKTEGTRA